MSVMDGSFYVWYREKAKLICQECIFTEVEVIKGLEKVLRAVGRPKWMEEEIMTEREKTLAGQLYDCGDMG